MVVSFALTFFFWKEEAGETDDRQKRSGKEVVKTMKNNSTLKLGEYAYIFDNSYSSGRNYSTSLAARTKITITYIDKYTKQECESIYSISRLAK